MEKINTYCFLTLNNEKGLERALETLYQHTPDNFYVYVVYQGKDDELYSRIKDKVHFFIRPQRNLGFAKGMNTMIKLATTEYVTICNDDVELLYPTWWDEVMEVFKSDDTLAGFNPHSPCNKKASGDRFIQYPYQKEYTMDDIAKMKEIFKSERFYIGCCTYFTIFKREFFNEVGLFDESFGQGSGEDYDLMIRAGRLNKRIAGGSRVMVWHWWGNTKDNMPVEEGGISNFNLIRAGNQNLTAKWGPHCDEVQRQLKDGRMTEEEAKSFNGGWSVSGKGGLLEPNNQQDRNYKIKGQWFIETNL